MLSVVGQNAGDPAWQGWVVVGMGGVQLGRAGGEPWRCHLASPQFFGR